MSACALRLLAGFDTASSKRTTVTSLDSSTLRLHSTSDDFFGLLPDCERASYARHLSGRKTKEVSDETVDCSSCGNDQSDRREPGVRAGCGTWTRSGCRHRDSRWRNVLPENKDANEPSFANYGLGAGVEVNFNRYIGVEGEVTGALGITQDIQFTNATANLKTPNMVGYSGNLVVSAPTHSAVVPYVTGGVGGLTLLDTQSLGINDTTTFLTGNVGGGLKWFSSNGRWGLRGDYRFSAVRSDENAPAFFGQDTRYGHRVYGGVLINAWR